MSTPQCACHQLLCPQGGGSWLPTHTHWLPRRPSKTSRILSCFSKKTEQIHKSCSKHTCRGENFHSTPATKVSSLPWNQRTWIWPELECQIPLRSKVSLVQEDAVLQKNKYHMISLICGILKKKWGYRWTYLQNRSRVTDVENNLMVTRG